mgnify:CR=1 FL=1
MAGAAGGIWKTVNAGTTFFPLWGQEANASMGDIAIAPSDTKIIWAGTGEQNSRNTAAPGYGVYKSVDGGVTWKSMGLQKTQHIGRIVIHPTNPNIVYVAALGAMWTSNPERGLYKTTDGGNSWQLIKFISDKAGFVDIVMDPKDPNTLYAAMWQRVRRKWSDPRVEPNYSESGIWKTTDGGVTWNPINSGLPEPKFRGRIGLDIARSNPNVIYAVVDSYDAGRAARPGERASAGRGRDRTATARSTPACLRASRRRATRNPRR